MNHIFFPLLCESLDVIHQDAAEAAGHLGQGTTVEVLDTGADYTRNAFGNCSAPNTPTGCRVVFAQDFTLNDDGALDAHGHGTNVSGIILGVAPDTRIAALDVFTGGLAYASDIIEGIDWIIANQAAYNIVAMNLSLGASNYSSECTNSWAASPFTNARAVGVTPVVASGNDASKSTLASPACTPGAVRVGATYDSAMGTMGWFNCTDNETQADLVTCFSNSASFLTLNP